MNQFEQQASVFLAPPADYDLKLLRKKLKRVDISSFEQIISELRQSSTWDKDSLSKLIQTSVNDLEIKMGDIMQLLRVFITGGLRGPDLYAMMTILGKEEVMNRMVNGIETANSMND